MILTAQDIQANTLKLATLNRADFEGATTKRLKDLIRGVGVSNVEQDGAKVQVSSARKACLVEALVTKTASDRVLHNLGLGDATSSADAIQKAIENVLMMGQAAIGPIAHSTYDELLTYVKGQWSPELQRWAAPTQAPVTLSMLLVAWSEGYRNEMGQPLQLNTKVSYINKARSLVGKLVRESEGEWYGEQLAAAYKMFQAHNLNMTRDLRLAVATADVARSEVRRSHAQPINPDALIAAAVETLEAVVALKMPRWGDVSIALAIVTGRRQSEIHATGAFDLRESGEVWFSGQLKKKAPTSAAYSPHPPSTSPDDAYAIPVLCDPYLVVAGHEYIKLTAYYPGDLLKVNQTVNTNISKRFIKLWYTRYLPTITDPAPNMKVRTYHRLREIYALVLVDRLTSELGGRHPSTTEMVRCVKSALGHAETGSAFERYDANFYIDRRETATPETPALSVLPG